MRKKTNRAGQSMFELLVAIFIIALTLTAVVGLVTTSISNTTFSKDKTLAAKYTQEAVEWFREQRDSNWGTFKGKSSLSGSNYCLNTLAWNAGNCSGTQYIAETNLLRQATLITSPTDPNSVEVRIVTSWSDQSGRHESRITTYFTNWRTR